MNEYDKKKTEEKVENEKTTKVNDTLKTLQTLVSKEQNRVSKIIANGTAEFFRRLSPHGLKDAVEALAKFHKAKETKSLSEIIRTSICYATQLIVQKTTKDISTLADTQRTIRDQLQVDLQEVEIFMKALKGDSYKNEE